MAWEIKGELRWKMSLEDFSEGEARKKIKGRVWLQMWGPKQAWKKVDLSGGNWKRGSG